MRARETCVNFIRRLIVCVDGGAVKPSPDRPVDKYLRRCAVVNNVATSELDN